MHLIFLILLPLLTAITVLLAKESKVIKAISLTGAVAQLLLVLVSLQQYYVHYNKKGNGFLFEERYNWFPSLNIHFHVGVDGIALAMLTLTAIVVLAGILVSWKIEKLTKEFFFLLLLLSAGAYGFFISLDLFTVFFFLEIAVIPKFLLIGIWGSGKKEYSAMKLALMLMGGSALIFIGLIVLYYNTSGNGFDWLQVVQLNLSPNIQKTIFPFLFIGFGVFTALFPFHTWVPDGHSSAPTAASMFLAGISMKLGGYGCLRVAAYLLPVAAHFYSPYIIALSTVAILYGAFVTMMQTDLKYINAYSSVSHCGFVLLGIGMLTQTSINGAVLQMVSHGLMTALFFAAIGMLYERTHTRQIKELGGLLKVMPFIATVFVIAGLCSLGLPGLSGFVAEMTVFMGSWQRIEIGYRIATILSCCSIVVTAVYILRAAGQSVMGPIKNNTFSSLPDANWNEKLAAIVLLLAIIVIGVAPFYLNNLIKPGTEMIMQKISASVK
jgi:NADH-quinone oxidoreductase subunit M